MIARWLVSLSLAAAFFGLGCAGGGAQDGEPALGDVVPEWATDTWLEDRETGGGSYIWVRNNTSRRVMVTSLYLTDCVNIRNPCNTRRAVNQQVAPNGEVRVRLVRPENPDRAWSFRYSYTIHSVRERPW